MGADPRLEDYLSSLERVLRPLPVSDRAEIVTEIKSHVLSALERDPHAQLDSVLAALGEPETVANRYLLERNLQPAKPPVSPIVKWVVIGFLGTFAMLLLFVGLVLFKFTPLIHVDEAHDHVSILGGLIDVTGDVKVGGRGQTTIGGFSFGGEGHSVHGTQLLAGKPFLVKFQSGKVMLTSSESKELTWTCKTSSQASPPPAASGAGEFALDLTALGGVRCELAVPEKAQLRLEGGEGKVDVDEPSYNLSVALQSGKVTIEPSAGRKYKYGLTVHSGKVEEFTSSDDPAALHIDVQLQSGKIGRGR